MHYCISRVERWEIFHFLNIQNIFKKYISIGVPLAFGTGAVEMNSDIQPSILLSIKKVETLWQWGNGIGDDILRIFWHRQPVPGLS